MNRRRLLIAGGGTVGAVVAGTTVASVTRADLLADGSLTRGGGEPVDIERSISREGVEYLDSTNEVRENGSTWAFETWARLESDEIGAEAVLDIVDSRLETELKGVGSGVRFLIFGPVVSVHYWVVRGRDGSIKSEPNVSFERLLSVAPRTLTVTVGVDGRSYTRTFPVGVSRGEASQA